MTAGLPAQPVTVTLSEAETARQAATLAAAGLDSPAGEPWPTSEAGRQAGEGQGGVFPIRAIMRPASRIAAAISQRGLPARS